MKGDMRIRPFSDAIPAIVQAGIKLIYEVAAQHKAKQMTQLKQKTTIAEAKAALEAKESRREDSTP